MLDRFHRTLLLKSAPSRKISGYCSVNSQLLGFFSFITAAFLCWWSASYSAVFFCPVMRVFNLLPGPSCVITRLKTLHLIWNFRRFGRYIWRKIWLIPRSKIEQLYRFYSRVDLRSINRPVILGLESFRRHISPSTWQQSAIQLCVFAMLPVLSPETSPGITTKFYVFSLLMRRKRKATMILSNSFGASFLAIRLHSVKYSHSGPVYDRFRYRSDRKKGCRGSSLVFCSYTTGYLYQAVKCPKNRNQREVIILTLQPVHIVHALTCLTRSRGQKRLFSVLLYFRKSDFRSASVNWKTSQRKLSNDSNAQLFDTISFAQILAPTRSSIQLWCGGLDTTTIV